jgi:hypothetical protein
MHLRIIKYMGEKLVNSKKFKCMCINMDSYSTAAVSGSLSYPSTLHMFTVQKCIVHTNTRVNPYIYIIHMGGLPKFELSVSIVSYQVFKPTFWNGKGAFNFVLLYVSVCPLLFWFGS